MDKSQENKTIYIAVAVQSFEAPNAEEPTYYMAVPGTQSAFIIWGADAENARLKMQLCA
ncbi:hypothetical protein HT105_24115 [Bacteroides fragilis]|nr:hypothetical protein [Bacteroides fragilis]